MNYMESVSKNRDGTYVINGNYAVVNNNDTEPIKLKDVEAYLAEHPEALVDEPVPAEPTKEQLALQEISVLKSNLLSTDYIPIKISEALALDEDADSLKVKYKEQLLERKNNRLRIKELENLLNKEVIPTEPVKVKGKGKRK